MGRRRRAYRQRQRFRKIRKGLPYIYNSKVYLGKRPQIGSGTLWKVLASLLTNVGDVIEI